LTNDGKIFLDTKASVAVAPDGNGGIYAALRSTTATGKGFSVLSDMKKRGIQYLYAYCVDNCLARVGDPVFLGYSISQKAQCGTKVVKKLDPTESVGVVALKNKKWNVIEYSEISKELSEAIDPHSNSGELLFRAANIANHFYDVSFLDRITTLSSSMAYHIARKKIAHVDLSTGTLVKPKPEKPNGMKLELFIFDVLPYLDASTTEHAIFIVDRKSEFSPLKNAPGTGSDDPQTSRRDLLQLQRRWLIDNGVTIDDETEVELSPLVSYAGEGLEIVKGRTVKKGSHVVNSLEQLEQILA
jgi:UDP-N-acetylglucosamine/UDP-N-acetylgalactosamine diphosphorylase